MNTIDKIISILLILSVIAIVIFVKPTTRLLVNSHKTIDSLKNEIIVRNQQINYQLMFVDSLAILNKQLQYHNDSLKNVKQQVKIKYEKIYVTISNANNNQLDSIIRTNW